MSDGGIGPASPSRVTSMHAASARHVDFGAGQTFDRLLVERSAREDVPADVPRQEMESLANPAQAIGIPIDVGTIRLAIEKAGFGIGVGSESPPLDSYRTLGPLRKPELEIPPAVPIGEIADASAQVELSILGSETHLRPIETPSVSGDLTVGQPAERAADILKQQANLGTEGERGPLRLLRITIDRGQLESVGATIRLCDGNLEVRLEACDGETAGLLGEHIGKLAEDLGRAGYSVERVAILQSAGSGMELSAWSGGEPRTGAGEANDANDSACEDLRDRPGGQDCEGEGEDDANFGEPAADRRSAGVYL